MSLQPVHVRGVTIGAGIPKICVPLVGSTLEALLAEAGALRGLPADLAEWRCDRYDAVDDLQAVRETLCALREELGNLPLLMTFRTAGEGGNHSLTQEDYIRLLTAGIQSGCVDLIDVELMQGEEVFSSVRSAAREAGVYVIASNHDFRKTPSAEEMLARLVWMEELGADIAKLAVMPNSPEDVLTLLEVTRRCSLQARIPLITMSMAGMGAVSRLCGETFGSALTFGSAENASAPGQIEVRQLAEVLRLLHEAQS